MKRPCLRRTTQTENREDNRETLFNVGTVTFTI